MKINNLILLLGLLVPALIFGQGEANNWYFGENAGISFNSDGSVNALTNGQLNTFEGCASISSPTGGLLFYTDGETVYDRNHNIMPNGTGLLGDTSSTQSAIIVPQPENPNLYYVFTVSTTTPPAPAVGLNYSVIDMNLNGGMGDVTAMKNINLLNDCAEKIAAVIKDCTANSIWIVALGLETPSSPRRPFNTYHSFELNASGIAATSVPSVFPTLNVTGAGVGGYLKISPDGTRLANASLSTGLFLYDFDINTGIVSNQQILSMNSATDLYAYGIEFSPNSQYLYVNASNNLAALTGHTASLFQFDLLTTAPTISASQTLLDGSRSMYRSALQLGPDGRIYRAIPETFFIGTQYLGVINSPDLAGLGSDYQHNAVGLNGRNSFQGLPPFVQAFYSSVDVLDDTGNIPTNFEVCEGQPLMLQTQFIPGATYEWVNGSGEIRTDTDDDGHILNLMNATISDSGTYVVTITKPTAVACPITGTLEVIVNPLPETNSDELFICDSDVDPNDGITIVDLTQLEDSANFTYTYYETQADRDADTNPIAAETSSSL